MEQPAPGSVGTVSARDWDSVTEILGQPLSAGGQRYNGVPGSWCTSGSCGSVFGGGGTAVGGVKSARTPSAPKLRKSCECCRARKKRCDGDGVNKCSLCASKGNVECLYNTRRSAAPKSARNRKSSNTTTGSAASGGYDVGGRAVFGGGKIRSGPALTTSAMRSYSETGMVPLKRCRLRASPATGLVGMQENSFLTDYFECMGFLPLASERDIRQALVSLMLSSLSPSQRDSGSDQPPQKCGTLDERGALVAPSRRRTTGKFPRSDASTCALWSAIAIGAIVQGRPINSMMGYAELARHSLRECFDEVSTETARAFVMMAFLHNFLGDEGKFKKYLNFAHGTVKALPPEHVSQDLVDLLKTADGAQLYSGITPTAAEVDNFCREDLAVVKTKDIVRKNDLCRLFLNTDNRLDQAFFKDMADLGIFNGERVDRPMQTEEGPKEHSMAKTAIRPPFCKPHRPTVRRPTIVDTTVVGEDLDLDTDATFFSDASGDGEEQSDGEVFVDGERPCSCGEPGRFPVPGHATRVFSRDALPEYKRLLEVAAWRMAYLYGMNHDMAGSRDRCMRFTEVILKYPGLCRFSTWRHHVHCALAVLCRTDARETYEKLRQAYNSSRPDRSPPAPPVEEWDLMTVCDHVFCRSVFQDILCYSENKPEISIGFLRRVVPPDDSGPSPADDNFSGSLVNTGVSRCGVDIRRVSPSSTDSHGGEPLYSTDSHIGSPTSTDIRVGSPFSTDSQGVPPFSELGGSFAVSTGLSAPSESNDRSVPYGAGYRRSVSSSICCDVEGHEREIGGVVRKGSTALPSQENSVDAAQAQSPIFVDPRQNSRPFQTQPEEQTASFHGKQVEQLKMVDGTAEKLVAAIEVDTQTRSGGDVDRVSAERVGQSEFATAESTDGYKMKSNIPEPLASEQREGGYAAMSGEDRGGLESEFDPIAALAFFDAPMGDVMSAADEDASWSELLLEGLGQEVDDDILCDAGETGDATPSPPHGVSTASEALFVVSM